MNKVKTSSQRSGSTKSNQPKRTQANRTITHKLFAHTHSADPMVHDEDEFEQDKPAMSLSKIFIVILLLHVLVIAGLAIMHNSNGNSASTAKIDTKEESSGAEGTTIERPDNQELSMVADTRPTQGVPVAPPNVTAVQPLPAGWESTLVKSGENIDAIARRVGVERKWLVKANAGLNRLNASNPAVKVGQMLAIPTPKVVEDYRVKERIALREAGMQSPVSSSTNSVTTPPVNSSIVNSTPIIQPEPVAGRTPAVDPPAPRGAEILEEIEIIEDVEPVVSTGKQHKVAKGETFYGIGRKYGVSAQDLMSHNGYSNPSALGIGDVLKIP